MCRTSIAAVLVVAATGCAIRLGGPKPEGYDVVALAAGSQASDQTADVIQQNGMDIALVASAGDSAWFADLATRTGMELSGPGRTGTAGLAFLTRGIKLLGDTSIVLGVAGGGRIHMHDALYEIGKNRNIDLMLVQIDSRGGLREVVRSLLGYIATDVGGDAAILLGLDAPDSQLADSVAVLMRAAFANAWDCTDDGRKGNQAPPLAMRLFYGPAVRMQCQHARLLSTPGTPISAHVVVGR